MRVLREGGNAIDAVVAAGLASCVAVPARCGVGGYGGHMIIGIAKSRKVYCIDYNTAAPLAARPDMYPRNERGEVIGKLNFHGWKAVGVPGTMAGFQMALDKFGTKSFRELVQPAIQLARDGVEVTPVFAKTIKSASANFRKDPGSAKIYLPNDTLPTAGQKLAYPALAELLATLAERNSVESFYRGDIAQRMAEEFQKNGGWVTAEDLAKYRARTVEPLTTRHRHFEIHTAPLTAGGLTILQAFNIWKASGSLAGFSGPVCHARLESLRLAWKDRLELLGDPEVVNVPTAKLLSADYAAELGVQARHAVREKTPLSLEVPKHLDEGTNHISAVDRHGNMVAMTITQGGGFGAQVTTGSLGVTLGHGMSRFNPDPAHPNAPAPGKRPLHNMCPSLVLKEGKPFVAVGGAGGVRIPSAVYDVLFGLVARGESLEESITRPRQHCTGTLEVMLERNFPADLQDYIRKIGFKVRLSDAAVVSAVTFDGEGSGGRGIMH
jgi:gamma-glutamyltranspeptidase/glutathione hydrolase